MLLVLKIIAMILIALFLLVMMVISVLYSLQISEQLKNSKLEQIEKERATDYGGEE